MKPISDFLFAFSTKETLPRQSYRRCLARDLGLRESWLRDAIFSNPALVMEPCKAAGLTRDRWYAWQREFQIDTGQIDVLLLSSQGRIAIVETKLATNPEIRRRVLAQVLDYLAHLAERLRKALPEIPRDEDGYPVANEEDILEHIERNDVLIVIASDEIDSKIAKLSQSLLSQHLTQQWDLVLVDIALYCSLEATDAYIIVPHIRHVVQKEIRQVIKIVVEGETPRMKKVLVEEPPQKISKRQRWNEERFFRRLENKDVPQAVRELAFQLRALAQQRPHILTLVWGTGKRGSMILKRNEGGLIEIYGTGEIRFRPEKFSKALGQKAATQYLEGLKKLIPEAMNQSYPRLTPARAAEIAPELFALIQKALSQLDEA